MKRKNDSSVKTNPSLTDTMRQKLGEVCPEDPDGRIWCDVLAEATLRLACEGNVAAMQQVLGRLGTTELKKIEEILLKKGEGMSTDSSELVEGKLARKAIAKRKAA